MLIPPLVFNDLSDIEFKYLRDIVLRESGINLTDRKKALMQSRLLRRLKSLNLDNFKMYCDYLENNYRDELINLINSITTNKTDFFREAKHFDYLKKAVFPSMEKNGKDRVRIWSAGCSTGEEPYSIAISISEYYRNRRMPDVKILATDIDTAVLSQAMSGLYQYEENIRILGEEIIKRYFLKGKGADDMLTANDKLKNMISFRRLNLLEEKFPMHGVFDLIFCRNVIIYFDKQTKERVINKLFSYLCDDGYFFAGHSELLPDSPDKYFLIGNTIYRKASK